MDGSNGILDMVFLSYGMILRRSKDDKRQINRWKIIVNRFVAILKNKDSKKIRHILLHWCYEVK